MSDLGKLALETGELLLMRQHILATAESCTGGWVAKVITDIAGSSAWFDSGYVTYSNAAKQRLLGVSPVTLERNGAVSEPVVKEMAAGALANSAATVSLAISGIAGPGGGTEKKPVGTVCFAWQLNGQEGITRTRHFTGDRYSVREQAVIHALQRLMVLIDSYNYPQ